MIQFTRSPSGGASRTPETAQGRNTGASTLVGPRHCPRVERAQRADTARQAGTILVFLNKPFAASQLVTAIAQLHALTLDLDQQG
jgi:hypothetical protein